MRDRHQNRSTRRMTRTGVVVLAGLFVVGLFGRAFAETIVLKDGRELKGRLGAISSLADDPRKPTADDAPQRILLIHDDLRRVFVPKHQLQEIRNNPDETIEVIKLKQPVTIAGGRLGTVGPIIKVTPFDAYGRRTFSMAANVKEGRLDIIQGITEITPQWTRVQALSRERSAQIIWDMRIATSSIPRETLSKILLNHVDRKKVDDRLKIVRLYVRAERYKDAEAELAGVIADFPDRANLKAEGDAIRQLGARRMIEEIDLRRRVGQHQLSQSLLKQFPLENLAGNILQQIKTTREEYDQQSATIAETKKKLDELLAQVEDTFTRTRYTPALEEIKRELNFNTIDRLTEFRSLQDAANLPPAQRLALAVTGWTFGGNAAVPEPSLAGSSFAARALIREYLRETQLIKQREIMGRLRSEEASSPRYVAKILANMKPPLDAPDAEPAGSGFHTLATAGLPGEPPVTYHVQLPPEYDPYRRYPTIVTLNGTASSAVQQIEWWAGEKSPTGMRLGQATRRGYIVVAPEWTRKGQTAHQFSAREHAAVLSSLRDACRRFSIDTDRVFLSGHSMGGDAAWDIALAHPDLWAGVVPIVPESDKYIPLYSQNARNLPMYFVAGELDGQKTFKNAPSYDRYVQTPGINFTLVEYLGRGHEHFYEEVQNIFDWLGKQQRNFSLKKFTSVTMRQWDNFFWWVEVDDIPASSIVHPNDWPAKGSRPMQTTTEIKAPTTGTQSVNVQTGAGQVTIWLTPELVDFSRPVRVVVKNRTVSGPSPDVEVMLEDVRTRGDRQHPFWARIDTGATKVKPTSKSSSP